MCAKRQHQEVALGLAPSRPRSRTGLRSARAPIVEAGATRPRAPHEGPEGAPQPAGEQRGSGVPVGDAALDDDATGAERDAQDGHEDWR